MRKFPKSNDGVRYIAGIFGLFLLYFIVLKAIFLFVYSGKLSAIGTTIGDIFSIFIHGLRHDAAVAAYLSTLPLLLIGILSFGGLGEKKGGRVIKKTLQYYFSIISIIIGLLFTTDLLLFGHWDFRLDATPLFYLQQPKDALSSATALDMLIGLIVWVVLSITPAYFLQRFHRKYYPQKRTSRANFSAIWKTLLGAGFLFLCIRGSIGVATLNVGSVYHSPKQLHNQAAINPAFSFLYACLHSNEDIADYQFIPTDECQKAFTLLQKHGSSDGSSIQESVPDSIDQVLKTKRPNIILILMESFSANAIGCLGGSPGHTPCIDSIAETGILFTHTFASSFRTDRGMVATLSGYPAQPRSSIIKYPNKVRNLPGLASSLKKAGYSTHYLYGGDADFTNVRSYLYATGYDEITDIHNFPIETRLSKWGAPDHITFPHLLAECKRLGEKDEPYFYSYLTLSSHEPFDVPSQHSTHPYLNSVYYTDSCLGNFINKMKATPEWDNTLIIAISDHGFPYPEEKALPDRPNRYGIMMLWSGGAIKKPMTYDKIVSQSDLAGTLLSQLGLPHDEYIFSKDIFRQSTPHFAYFSFPGLIGLATSEGTTIYDFENDQIVYGAESPFATKRRDEAKVMLQTVMEDMLSR